MGENGPSIADTGAMLHAGTEQKARLAATFGSL